MRSTIQVGTILLNQSKLMTDSFALETSPYSGNWSVVEGLDGFAVDRNIHAAGWNFLFMAGEVKAMFWGALGPKKIQNALRRILEKVKQQQFNGLEVTGVVARRFLGMPYSVVTAHSRHVQQTCRLDSAEERRASQHNEASARD
jgi:hypothetical protein